MIDWGSVAANGIWILGLSVLITILSYGDWSAHQIGMPLQKLLGSQYAGWLWAGLALFCSGMALAGGGWRERLVWGALTIAAAGEAWRHH